MNEWSIRYSENEPHSFQMYLLNYRSHAKPGEQHDGCVAEMWNPTRYYPMTPDGFMMPDAEPITAQQGLECAKRLVELAYKARGQGMTETESIEYAYQVAGVQPRA